MENILAFIFENLRSNVFLMLGAGTIYLLSALFLFRLTKGERTELMNALLTFLVYQAIAKFAMGFQMYTGVAILGQVAVLAVLIGATYMLKFPFSIFSSAWVRRVLFMVAFGVSVLAFAWFLQTPEKQATIMSFIVWYDLVVNGLVVGGTIILYGLRSSDRFYRTKALSGGSGVMSCCVVANVAMISGAALVSSFFQILAPVLILGSFMITKHNKNQGI